MEVRCAIFGTKWADIEDKDLERGDVIDIKFLGIREPGYYLIERKTPTTYRVAPITKEKFKMFKSGEVKQRLRDCLMNYPIEDCPDYEEMLTEMEIEMIDWGDGIG